MSFISNIDVEPLEFEEESYYIVTVRNTRSCGILRFSEELVLTMKAENGDIVFVNGWEINCGESWTWEKEDLERFELDHPGLLDLVRGELLSERAVA